MSKIVVKVCKIDEIIPHGNADALEVACVGAWTTCVKKDVFAAGDLVVFIPPDAILPKELHEHLGITQYCGEMPQSSGEAEQGKRRVRATRLRGVRSFGTLMTIADVVEYFRSVHGHPPSHCYPFMEGNELSVLLGITKYEPPEKIRQGDQMTPHALFHKYTDIERYQNFPSLLKEGEEVVILEKIHGTNCRVGLVMTDVGLTFMAGSHNTRRKAVDTIGHNSLYWKPLDESIADMKGLLEYEQHEREAVSIIVFCEIYGPGIQDMQYAGYLAYRVFDIAVNGEYLNWDDVERICKAHAVPTVPVLYQGPFSEEVLMEHTDGNTQVCEAVTGKFKGREGCVVKPIVERQDFDIPSGRVILKSVGADYLNRKGGTDNA